MTQPYNMRRLWERRPDLFGRSYDHYEYRGDDIITMGPVETIRLRAAVRLLLRVGLESPSETTRKAVTAWAARNPAIVRRAHGHPIDLSDNPHKD